MVLRHIEGAIRTNLRQVTIAAGMIGNDHFRGCSGEIRAGEVKTGNGAVGRSRVQRTATESHTVGITRTRISGDIHTINLGSIGIDDDHLMPVDRCQGNQSG